MKVSHRESSIVSLVLAMKLHFQDVEICINCLLGRKSVHLDQSIFCLQPRVIIFGFEYVLDKRVDVIRLHSAQKR